MCTNNERHEMISSSDEADSSTKQEGNTSEAKIITKASSTSPSPWQRLKDPRIVRVSRTFGGKDRHSKVCTIRGLRDRRVRLSVPTAIQLYDLQDRLGLNQPSKVVDWLLNAAKDEIDELPPLPALPTGNFGINHQEILSSKEVGSSQSNKEGFRIEGSSMNSEGAEGLPRSSNAWSSEALWRAKSKETAIKETIDEKENWTAKRTEEKQDGNDGGHDAEASSINFLSRHSNSSLPSLLNNALPFGSYYHLEPSHFPFSQLGSHGFTSQTEDIHNFNVVPLPSALSLSSGSQILVCPPHRATQPFFPSHVEIDPRQINHFQMLSPSSHNLFANSLSSQTPQAISQPMRPFQFGMTSRFLHSHSGTASDHESDKDQEFPSK